MEQLVENVELFSHANDPVTESDKEVLRQVVDTIAKFAPCTSCRYCCDSCPQNLDIPLLISIYNEALYDVSWYVFDALEPLGDSEKPHACIECGACSALCPQSIDIPDLMKKLVSILERKRKK